MVLPSAAFPVHTLGDKRGVLFDLFEETQFVFVLRLGRDIGLALELVDESLPGKALAGTVGVAPSDHPVRENSTRRNLVLFHEEFGELDESPHLGATRLFILVVADETDADAPLVVQVRSRMGPRLLAHPPRADLDEAVLRIRAVANDKVVAEAVLPVLSVFVESVEDPGVPRASRRVVDDDVLPLLCPREAEFFRKRRHRTGPRFSGKCRRFVVGEVGLFVFGIGS